MKHILFPACIALLSVALSASDERMVIHEWGTFTSLQNLDGDALGGINVDDEQLPKFVKTLHAHLIRTGEGSKGFNYAHPDVTMRLETPVVYFHPPKSMKLPHTLDFSVTFKGGWLTQFYPNADAVAPGLKRPANDSRQNIIASIYPSTVSSLTWKNLKIGVDASVPVTDSKVWNAPRLVDAATVSNAAGEAEKYLFYRGVGSVRAPFRVERGGLSGTDLVLAPHCYQLYHEVKANVDIKTLWYAHFKPDGTCAFREWHPGMPFSFPSGYRMFSGRTPVPNEFQHRLEKWAVLRTLMHKSTPAEFSPEQYNSQNLDALKSLMRTALIADGLFADEADALLNTWDVSYFKNPGLRLFFLAPRVWTDHVLPLTVSEPATIVRSMVGRIELISPEHIAALDALSNPELFKTDAPGAFKTEAAVQQAYAQIKMLGRFVTPLLADRQRTNPSPGLKWIANIFATPAYVTEPPK